MRDSPRYRTMSLLFGSTMYIDNSLIFPAASFVFAIPYERSLPLRAAR
jgi:hypothetical protein